MTKNFKIQEFECKGGCDMPLEVYENIIKLASQLQFLRDYNAQISGSSKKSQHQYGKAADITIQSLKPAEVYRIIEDLIDMGHMLQGGLGLYDTFVHYDIRKTKARWNG